MTRNYLDILADTIRDNWNEPALTDFYLTDEGSAHDTSRRNNYTYGEMYAQMMHLGDMFRALGLKKGDHIAICGSNSANWVVSYLAIAAFQGVSVNIMQTQSPEDIAYQIDFSDAKALITDKVLWDILKVYSLPKIEHVVSLDDFSLIRENDSTPDIKLIQDCSKENINIPPRNPDDLATICFTSGSSGISKGVMLSYLNISSSNIGVVNTCKIHNNKNVMSFLPLAHAYVLGTQILTPFHYGCHVYLFRNQFTFEGLLKALLAIKPYSVSVVPAIASAFINGKVKPLIPLITQWLEYLVIGGAEFSKTTEDALVHANIPIAPGYGLTETAALISLSPFSQYRNGSSGKVVDTLCCRISEEGEILVKGENVMLGYYKNPEATAQKIDADGWLHTGDAGYMDEDGYLYVTGRIGQDIIVLPNGENIHPEDIESKINALPEVADSIVVVRDGKLVALVVLEHAAKSKEQELHQQYMAEIRRTILRTVNPQLPLYSQLYDVELLDKPIERTAKHTIKRYLYK
ncbi:MAG: AMP-binding protein [Paludibacteraceae bacterium]|nr:AMP-binding protein [Paludibacteraceae bacterium]